MKKVLSIVLSLLMLISIITVLPFSACALSEGFCGENVTYTFDSETGVLTISGTGNMTDYSSSNSPFYNKASIKSVVINYGVTSIGNYALRRCIGLTSIEISNSITSIGNYAFNGCNELTSIEIPNSVISIGSSAFRGCIGLTSAIIGNSVISIGNFAFRNCSGLTSIEIPNSVTSVGQEAFAFCDKLISIKIGSGVSYIGAYAFWVCDSLVSISVDSNNLVFDSRENCNAIIKTADDSLVLGCKNTAIPCGIARIGTAAFKNCNGLTSIEIPESVTSIGTEAFSHCTALREVTMLNGTETISSGAFESCSGITNLVIPDSIKYIQSGAFTNCSGLKELTMPCSANIIASNDDIPDAFVGCDNIDKITLTKGNGTMQNYTVTNFADFSSSIPGTPWYFSNKENIDIILEDGIRNIGNYAFFNCDGITRIEIPASVTNIGEGAFRNCKDLSSIVILNKDCIINESEDTVVNTAVILGYENSTAQHYAQYHSRTFVPIDVADCDLGNHCYVRKTYIESTCTVSGYAEYVCYFCGLCYLEDIPAQHSYSNGFCKKCGEKDSDYVIPSIKANRTRYVNIESGGDTVFLLFEPTVSGEYSFFSSGSYDTYGYLYDADMNQLGSDDEGGDDSNFKIDYNFEAGRTYYLACKFWSSSQTGGFDVSLTTDLISNDPSSNDLSSLIAAIEEAFTYTNAEYTQESVDWLHFAADICYEYYILDGSEATQSEIDEVTAELLNLINELDPLSNYDISSFDGEIITLINNDGNTTSLTFSDFINEYCESLDVVKDGIVNAKDFAYLLKNF